MRKKLLAAHIPEKKESNNVTIGEHCKTKCPFCGKENRNSTPRRNSKFENGYIFRIDGNSKCKHFVTAEDRDSYVYFVFDDDIANVEILEEKEFIIKEQPVMIEGHYIDSVDIFLNVVRDRGTHDVLEKLNGINHSYAFGPSVNERGIEIIKKILEKLNYSEEDIKDGLDEIIGE